MNIIDIFTISDIFTKTSIVLLLLLIILVSLLLKFVIKYIVLEQSSLLKALSEKKQPKQQEQSSQIIFNKQNKMKNKSIRILRNYSILGCCLSDDKTFWKFLNCLHLLTCFCGYYALLISNMFGIQDEGDTSDESLNEGVRYLFVSSLSCWWFGGILIIIDFFARNYLQTKEGELIKIEKSKLKKQDLKAEICFLYNIWSIYTGILSVIAFTLLSYLLYQSLTIPPAILPQTLSFLFLVQHLTSRAFLQIPLLILFHQISVFIFSASCFLITKLQIQKSRVKNTHQNQVKITTTMDILGDESNENLQGRIQEKMFISSNKKQKQEELNSEKMRINKRKARKEFKRSPPLCLDHVHCSSSNPYDKKENSKKESVEKPKIVREQQVVSPFVCKSLCSRNTAKNRSPKSSLYELPEKISFNQISQFKGIAQFEVQSCQNDGIQQRQSNLGDIQKGQELFQKKQEYDFQGYQFKDLGVIDRSKQPRIQLHKRNKKRSMVIKQHSQNIAPPRKRRFSNLEYCPRKQNRASGPILYESPEKRNRQFCFQEIKEVYLKQ